MKPIFCFLILLFPLIAYSAEQPAPTIPVLPNPPAIPETAAILTALEYEKIPPLNRPFVKFIWSPTASDSEYSAVTATINFSLNESSIEYTPARVAHNHLIVVDLTALANDEKTLQRITTTWNTKFASREPYFHVHLVTNPSSPEKPGPLPPRPNPPSLSKDGKSSSPTPPLKDTSIPTPIPTFTIIDLPAPYLGEAGNIIEQYNGNSVPCFIGEDGNREPNPAYYSYTPVCRADWFNRIAISSIDGGLYNDFINVKPGETSLDSFLASHGASLTTAQDANAIESFIKGHSDITGKPRRVRVYAEQGVRLTTNSPIVAITDDPSDDSIKFDPLSGERDPNLSLLLLKGVFHEVFVTKPNGWVYFLLSDDKGTLLAEAAANVVSDRLVPPPYPTRLQSASCIRCHGPSGLWQPLRSEIIPLVHNYLKINTDLSQGTSTENQFNALRQIRFQYGAEQGDLDMLLMQARLGFDRRAFATTHINAVPLLKSVSDLYDSYEYGLGTLDGAVTPIIASRELGFDPDPKLDPMGITTFAQVVPPLDPNGLITSGSAGLLNRLTTTYQTVVKKVDPKTDLIIDQNEEHAMTLTRREWERVYPDAMSRAASLIHQTLEQPTYQQPKPEMKR